MKRYLFAIAVALLLVGCQSTLQETYIKKSDAEKQIAALVVEHQKQLDAAVANISTKKDEVISAKDFQLQAVSDFLYGANTAFSFYTTPGRIDLIINNRVKEADAATGKKPTTEAMERENKRLADELDETKISLEKLKATHNAVVVANTELANKTTKLEDDLKKALTDIAEMKIAHSNELITEQNKLIELQNKINTIEKKRSDNAAWVRNVKIKVASVLGLIALACIAGAIWSPVYKQKFAIGAAVMGAASAGVIYVQGWMVALAVGLIVAILVILGLREYHISRKTNKNLICGIDEIKSKLTVEDKASLKAVLTDWNSKVDSTGKKIVDPAVEKLIQNILIESDKI